MAIPSRFRMNIPQAGSLSSSLRVSPGGSLFDGLENPSKLSASTIIDLWESLALNSDHLKQPDKPS